MSQGVGQPGHHDQLPLFPQTIPVEKRLADCPLLGEDRLSGMCQIAVSRSTKREPVLDGVGDDLHQ